MTGQELLNELDIPVGQYRLSVKFPEDSERVGVPKNFSGNMTEQAAQAPPFRAGVSR